MRILLMVLGLVAFGAEASGQHVLITKDTTYVASGITARGASIELYEFDSTSMKPLMVGKIMPEERVKLIVFTSEKSKRRFEDRYSREGVSKIVLNPLPEWLVEELSVNRNLDYRVVENRLSQKSGWAAVSIDPEAELGEDPIYFYAQIMGIQKFLSTKVNITVDFGQSRGFFTDTRLRDEKTGQVQSFNSMVDAMNYMALDGWEFVQAYAISVGQQNVYHYLMRKKR